MGVTALITGIGSALYQSEQAQGQRREAEYQARVAEDRQQALQDEAKKKQEAADLQRAKQAEGLALRDRARTLKRGTGQTTRENILTGPQGVTGGSTGGGKTLLGM